MTIYKTTIKRAKHPLSLENLKPNGVYAVFHILPSEIIPEWNTHTIEQWGIVQLDADRKVHRSWNVTSPQKWTTEHVELSELKVFYATQMEQQYAIDSELASRYSHLYNSERQRNIILEHRLRHYEESRAHRIAEAIRNFLS